MRIAAWSLTGLINGQRVEVVGSGMIDSESGRMTLDLRSDESLPEGFGLIPAQMICNAPCTGYAAAATADGISWSTLSSGGLRVKPTRIGRVHTADGLEVLRISAITTLSVTPDGLRVDNLVEGFANLPSSTVVVSASETLLPGAPGRAVGLAQFELQSGSQQFTGLTTSPYEFTSTSCLPSVLVRQIDFSGSAGAMNGAHVETCSKWESLVAAGVLQA